MITVTPLGRVVLSLAGGYLLGELVALLPTPIRLAAMAGILVVMIVLSVRLVQTLRELQTIRAELPILLAMMNEASRRSTTSTTVFTDATAAMRRLGRELTRVVDDAVGRLNPTQRAIYFARLRGGELPLDILADLTRWF